MAYLREEKETLEVSYPLNAVWEAIPKAVAKLEWTIEETNEETHYVKIKTKGAFLSYPSKLKVNLSKVDENTTKMSIGRDSRDYDYFSGRLWQDRRTH